MKKVLLVIAGLVGALVALAVVGLRLKPRAFANHPVPVPTTGALRDTVIHLPPDLPPPVLRFFQKVFGHGVPVIHSAVITGRARLRIRGVSFPSRFRFVHDAGKGYRHYIESAVFGIPLMKVDEHYLDGTAILDLPFGVVKDEPKIDSAASLTMWAEAFWLPSILLTDPRLQWQAIDESSASLLVPGPDGEETLVATFDLDTDLLLTLVCQRWKAANAEAKVEWTNRFHGWKELHGVLVPTPATIQWADEATPWSEWEVEDIVYNADVSEYVRQRGP